MIDRQKRTFQFPVAWTADLFLAELLKPKSPQYPIAHEDTLGLLDRLTTAYDRIGYRLNWLSWTQHDPQKRPSGLYAVPKNEPTEVGTTVDLDRVHLLTTGDYDIENLIHMLVRVPMLKPSGSRVFQVGEIGWSDTFDATQREYLNLLNLLDAAREGHRNGLTSRHLGATILDTGSHQPGFLTGDAHTFECLVCRQPWPCNAAKSLMDVVKRRIGGVPVAPG